MASEADQYLVGVSLPDGLRAQEFLTAATRLGVKQMLKLRDALIVTNYGHCHTAVRETAGVFDVSHMGYTEITGAGAIDWLNSIVVSDLSKIGAGQAQYSMLLNDSGGVVDDLIVYRWADDEVFIVPNASNAAAVVAEHGAEFAAAGAAFRLVDERHARRHWHTQADERVVDTRNRIGGTLRARHGHRRHRQEEAGRAHKVA